MAAGVYRSLTRRVRSRNRGTSWWRHDEHARKGCQMRYRSTFIAGFAAGFIAGARAGRERYEQIKTASRKVTENPAVRKTAQVAGQKAVQLGRAAGDRAASRVPRLTETAKSSASKVR